MVLHRVSMRQQSQSTAWVTNKGNFITKQDTKHSKLKRPQRQTGNTRTKTKTRENTDLEPGSRQGTSNNPLSIQIVQWVQGKEQPRKEPTTEQTHTCMSMGNLVTLIQLSMLLHWGDWRAPEESPL